MQIRTRLIGAALVATAIGALASRGPAQAQITPLAFDQGATGLGLALRHLPNDGSVLMVTAHPDDENNGLLVRINRGLGIKTSLLTVTRGDGGQNEIGPELFQAIGILRSEELAAVHQYDGADQYHTRAYEFGYSFSDEETFQKWGREQILEDVVRVVRKVRPDVIVTMPRQSSGTARCHHQRRARPSTDVAPSTGASRAAAAPGASRAPIDPSGTDRGRRAGRRRLPRPGRGRPGPSGDWRGR